MAELYTFECPRCKQNFSSLYRRCPYCPEEEQEAEDDALSECFEPEGFYSSDDNESVNLDDTELESGLFLTLKAYDDECEAVRMKSEVESPSVDPKTNDIPNKDLQEKEVVIDWKRKMRAATQKRAKRAKWEKKFADKLNAPATNPPIPATTSDFEEKKLSEMFSDYCSTSEEENELKKPNVTQ